MDKPIHNKTIIIEVLLSKITYKLLIEGIWGDSNNDFL